MNDLPKGMCLGELCPAVDWQGDMGDGEQRRVLSITTSCLEMDGCAAESASTGATILPFRRSEAQQITEGVTEQEHTKPLVWLPEPRREDF